MEDETAEIELLQQNLNKTRQISKRMISILDSFDTRIAKLEKSILPLYSAAQVLNKRNNNIDKALGKIEEVASNQEDPAIAEALIQRGPQPGQLDAYKDAIEGLNATIAFKASNHDQAEAARLVETGANKLTQLYTKVVAEGSSGTTPIPGTELPSTTFPSSLFSTLSPVVSFLRTLPLPSTHPSHPAAPAILSTLQDAQRGYADMRGNWSVKCLEGQGKRLVLRADTIDPIVTGREFGEWVELLLGVAEDEYTLLKELTPLSSPAMIASAYGTLLAPILTLFNSILNQLVTFTKKSLQRYSFLALSAHEALSQLQPHWDEVLSRRGFDNNEYKNELKDGLQTLRGLCLRSFPEFLADVKLATMARGLDTSTKLADFTITTVKYLSRIPQVQSAAAAALHALGDGNWKMGEGVQVGQQQRPEENDESIILEHFIFDLVMTVLSSLNTISRTGRRPAFGSIYLLNNVSYLRKNLLLQPKHMILPSLISQPAKDALNSNFRTAKAAYFDSNFTPLMQSITDDPKEKIKKDAAKEKFTRFYDLLEEVMERHRMAKVLEEDKEEREVVGEEVVMLVVPSIQQFTQKAKGKEFSKNPQKYIKMSPDDIEKQIRTLFS
ncbi:exocyst complex component exo70 subunit [Crucibulum laeve]|uniref:Exocyst complex protein EXO70 n=1 Tax=Crucibulum laeve TaxID=68775 RepID=A0A5C3LIL6_9AGAR|nr:exocyst complex component exo70 subunit [Crucibulum laeve]